MSPGHAKGLRRSGALTITDPSDATSRKVRSDEHTHSRQL